MVHFYFLTFTNLNGSRVFWDDTTTHRGVFKLPYLALNDIAADIAITATCVSSSTTVLTRKIFLRRRISYYSNSSATFNPELLQIIRSGDIHPQPGPETRVKCLTCSRTIARNHRSTTCTTCKSRFHIKCSGLSVTNYKRIHSGYIRDWNCSGCNESVQSVFGFSDSFFEEENEIKLKMQMSMTSLQHAWKITMQTCIVPILICLLRENKTPEIC